MKKIYVCFALLFLLAAACNNENNNNTTIGSDTTKKAVKTIPTPVFNQDSAYVYIEKQVSFGPRVPGTDAHKACGDYLVTKLKSFGADVIVQEASIKRFDGKNINMKNVIAQYDKDNNNRVLLFAHWDSRYTADQEADAEKHKTPIDGANDGASGVGVLLEIARQLQQSKPLIGIDIIFFDAEDQGDSRSHDLDTWCLGSQYWSRNKHKTGYFARYGILLDMVGGTNAIFTRESNSVRFAPAVLDMVWATAHRLGYSNYFSFEKTQFVGTDDHVPVSEIANIPSIDIIQYDATRGSFASYWHTHSDNMSSIDRNTLKAVGQTVLEVVYSER